MPTLSLKKIALIVIGIIVLFHLKAILHALASVYAWFGENLAGMRDFPAGARAAIAFATLLLMLVLVCKHLDQ